MAHPDDSDGTAKTVRRPAHVPGQPAEVAPPESAASLPPPASDDPLIGVMLGEYQVLGFLGAGGMGNVYRGVQPVIGRPVAIKVMRREFSYDPNSARRFLEEARSVSAARHPGIVDVFGFGVTPSGEPYLVMELLEGESLDVVLQDRGALPVKDALALFIPMMNALGAAHAVGVVHRDLKPANVFVVKLHDGTTFPKLVDFGLARRGIVGGVQHQTSVAGTPAYIAPEQARGEPVGPGSDLYGFGCLAYEVLVGQPPFTSKAYGELLEAHLTQLPQPLRERLPDLPEALELLVLQLLEKEVGKRPTSALEVRERLERIQAGLGVAPGAAAAAARPVGAALPGAAPQAAAAASSLRRRGPRWGLATAVVGLGVLGAVMVALSAAPPPGEAPAGDATTTRRPEGLPADGLGASEPGKVGPTPPVEPALPPAPVKPAVDPPAAAATAKSTSRGGASPVRGAKEPTGTPAPKVSRGSRHTEADLKRKRQQLQWRLGQLPDNDRPKALLRLHDSRDCVPRGDSCWQELLDIEETYFPK